MNMAILTARQQEVLEFITANQAETGVMPSSREIQEHFKFSSQTAAMNHLKALEKKGVIQRRAGKARAVALTSSLKRGRIVDVPIFGSIVAGMAEAVDQEGDGSMALDAAAIGVSGQAKTFALRVRGDSMIDAQITEGDLGIFEIREPRHGDIVAALIDGETTLKRYVVESGRRFLRAENERYPDLIPVTELVVQGVLVALVRKYRG